MLAWVMNLDFAGNGFAAVAGTGGPHESPRRTTVHHRRRPYGPGVTWLLALVGL
jgi:hypothetical protein